MTVVRNSFPGSDGTALTAGAAGNTVDGGTYLDTIGGAGGGTIRFDTSEVIRAGSCCEIIFGASAGDGYVAWTSGHIASWTDCYVRMYAKIVAFPAGPVRLFCILNGSALNIISLDVETNGSVSARYGSGSTLISNVFPAGTIAANTVYRIEVYGHPDASAGHFSFRIFDDPASASPSHSYDSATNLAMAGPAAEVRAGQGQWTTQNGLTIRLDDLQASNEGWIGPATWSILQSNGGTQTCAFIRPLTAGSKMVVIAGVCYQSAVYDPTGVSDGSHAFTMVAHVTGAGGGTSTWWPALSVWVLDTPAGGVTPTITVTWPAGGATPRTIIMEVSGLAAGDTASVDGTPGTYGPADPSSPWALPAYSSAAAKELLIAVACEDGWGHAVNGPAGYILEPHSFQSGGTLMQVAYKDSVGAAESGSWTWTGSSYVGADLFLALELPGGAQTYERAGGGMAVAAGDGLRTAEYQETGGGAGRAAGSGALDYAVRNKAGGAAAAGIGSGAKLREYVETGGAAGKGLGSGPAVHLLVYTRAGGAAVRGLAGGGKAVDLPVAGGAMTAGAGSGPVTKQTALAERAGAAAAQAAGSGLVEHGTYDYPMEYASSYVPVGG